jgi:hypothetical protein
MTDTQEGKRAILDALENPIIDLVRAAKLVFHLAADQPGMDELLDFSIGQCRNLAEVLEEKFHTSFVSDE